MVIKNRVVTALSLVLLSAGAATAQPSQIPTAIPTLSAQEKLEIGNQIDKEVDRAFGHTTTLLNFMLVVLTLLPILTAVGLSLLRRSVISQLVTEAKEQLEKEISREKSEALTQLEKMVSESENVSSKLKKQIDIANSEIEIIRNETKNKMQSMVSDAEKQKDEIMKNISSLMPSSLRLSFEPGQTTPQLQQRLQELTKQLELLNSANPQLSLTSDDYIQRGDALYFAKNYDDAIVSYDKAIGISPSADMAWYGIGNALRKLQRYEEAITSYNKAIQIQPKHFLAWVNRGNALKRLQRYQEAIDSCEKAIQINPDYSRAWYNKACYYALQSNINQGVENLKQAIKFTPQCREMAKTDPDYDAIREDDRFNKLIEG